MKKLLQDLWREECGGLIAAEYLLIGTLLTIGLFVGVRAIQGALLEKLEELTMLIGG